MRRFFAYIIALCCTFVACTTDGGSETFEPYLQIRPESVKFDAKGGVESVQVLANFDYEIVSNVDWLSAEKDLSRDFWINVIATDYLRYGYSQLQLYHLKRLQQSPYFLPRYQQSYYP